MLEYRVDSDLLEPPRGSFFTTVPKFELEIGDLALFSLAGFLLPGRWFHDGDEIWILIPGYRIRITGEIDVTIIGLVVPISAGRFNRIARSALLVASMAIIEIYDLAISLAA